MLGLANLVPGHVVSRGFDLGCCVRCRAKKASQILLKLYFSKPFLFSLMVQGDHWSEWDCKNDQRHPNMYKILTKMFYFQFVGSHRSPLLHFPFHPVSHGLALVCHNLEKLLKRFKKYMFADLLSLHDGPRRTCNKPRHLVSYVNLLRNF